VEGFEGVRGICAAGWHSFAVTQSGNVFSWGRALLPETAPSSLQPRIVEGFGGENVLRVCAGPGVAFAIGEARELFSWGHGKHGRLGHGDTEDQPSPKRVEALLGVRVSSVSVGVLHAVALTEDGLVYASGVNARWAVLGNRHATKELLPKPVEALRGVRVFSVAASSHRSYVVTDRGELWAWGAYGNLNGVVAAPLGHGETSSCPVPKPIESLRGVKVDAVARPASVTRWRWRTTGTCTRGATTGQRSWELSAWAVR
jgi:E3 ubiquitin-protein ligase HERC2